MPGRENLNLVLFLLFCLSAAIQLWYYFWFYLAPAIRRETEKEAPTEPVSVIICARNEAENLRRFLPVILEQDYASYEVIIVNDCSEDKSDDILGELLLKYPNLRVSSITKDPRFTHNKKFAQFIGIKAASNEILLFTDADCRPESDKWITKMVSNFSNSGTEFVLGYGSYEEKKGLLNRYIRYDTFFIGMQYLGMAIRGIPYMGVGRNMAYKKQVFFRNKGFGIHNHIISGDDDLFVNGNATSMNTAVEFGAGSRTVSVPAANVAEWVKQKQRHLTTGKYYRQRDKILLLLEPSSRVILYSLFIVLISFLYLWPALVAILGARLIVQLIVFELNMRRLNERKILLVSLFFDIFSPLINIALYLFAAGNRPGKLVWK